MKDNDKKYPQSVLEANNAQTNAVKNVEKEISKRDHNKVTDRWSNDVS